MPLGLFGILFVVFLVLKLAAVAPIVGWSWWWVTAPLWGGFILWLSFALIDLLYYAVRRAWRVPAVGYW